MSIQGAQPVTLVGPDGATYSAGSPGPGSTVIQGARPVILVDPSGNTYSAGGGGATESTTVHVDGTHVAELDISSTAVLPADIGAEPAITGGTAAQFWRGDKTWATPTVSLVTPNVQGGSYTITLADAGKVIEFTGSVTSYFVIPANSSVPFPIGTVIEIFQAGTGQVNVGGATIRSRGNLYNTAGQYASAAVRQRAIDEWVLTGDLA